MKIAPRKFRVPLAIVATAVTLPLLAGCFGNPIGGIVKAATGGKVNVGSGSLPSDFPSDVKVTSGKIDSAVSLGTGSKEVWTVAIEVSGATSIKAIKSQLKAAGFAVEGGGTTSDSDAAGLLADDKKHSVIVGIAKANGKWVASYIVSASDDTSN